MLQREVQVRWLLHYQPGLVRVPGDPGLSHQETLLSIGQKWLLHKLFSSHIDLNSITDTSRIVRMLMRMDFSLFGCCCRLHLTSCILIVTCLISFLCADLAKRCSSKQPAPG